MAVAFLSMTIAWEGHAAQKTPAETIGEQAGKTITDAVGKSLPDAMQQIIESESKKAVREKVNRRAKRVLIGGAIGVTARRRRKEGKMSTLRPKPPEVDLTPTYRHGQVTKELRGKGALAFWLFTPSDPVPKEAPVILFLHGWRATNPHDYGGWIDHLARRGNIVIYPIFEASRSDAPEAIITHAIEAVKEALELLKAGPIQPRFDRFAIVGHSLGGGLTAQVAARAQEAGLPVPKAIMPTQPGWKGGEQFPTDKLSQIPTSVLMLVVVGDKDQFEKTRQGKVIFQKTPQIPDERKRYVIVQSDSHGRPSLVADHASPLSPREEYGEDFTRRQLRRRRAIGRVTGMGEGTTNVLDYLGYWRLCDNLMEAAFSDRKIDAVIGSPETLSMGEWSDGTPLAPLIETQTP